MAPALPLDTAGSYVAAAYLVFLALVLVYVAIMATRLARIDRELADLSRVVEERAEHRPHAASPRGPSDEVASPAAGSGERVR